MPTKPKITACSLIVENGERRNTLTVHFRPDINSTGRIVAMAINSINLIAVGVVHPPLDRDQLHLVAKRRRPYIWSVPVPVRSLWIHTLVGPLSRNTISLSPNAAVSCNSGHSQPLAF